MANAFLYLGNFWAAVALVLVIGKSFVRDSPTMYSFLSGRWVEPFTYNCWIAGCVVAAVVYFGFCSCREAHRDRLTPSAFFYLANFWAAIALSLVVCQRFARDSPTMYSFLNGRWVEPFTYNCWIGGCVAAAVLYFGLYFYRASRQKP